MVKWKDEIEAKLNLLVKQKVLGPVVRTPEGVKLIEYKWIFVQNNIIKNDNYMKISKRFNLTNNANSKVDYSIKLKKSLLWIKAIKMYSCPCKYLLKERYLSLYLCENIEK